MEIKLKKGVKPKMRGRELKNSVNCRGPSKQNSVKRA